QGQVEHGLAHAALLDEAAAEEAAGREDHRVGLEARAALEQDRPGPSRRDVDPDDARGLALDGGGRPLQGRREPQALAAPGAAEDLADPRAGRRAERSRDRTWIAEPEDGRQE